MTVAAQASADLPAFNRAVLAGDFPAAAAAAADTWPTLDHNRPEIAIIAREFAWMSMLGGRPQEARKFAAFLVGTPSINDATPRTSKLLLAWADFRLVDNESNRNELLDLLQSSLTAPGVDLVAIAAANELAAAGKQAAQSISEDLQKRRTPSLTKQRHAELTAIINAFAEERDAASYVAMVKLDEALHGEALHPANAPMREELFALHDEAWAWRTAMESILQGSSDTGYPLVDVRHSESLAMRSPVAVDEKPPCPGEVQQLAKIKYPRTERKDFLVGSVIVDTGFDSGGNVVNPRILAAVPAEGGFKEAVLSAAEKWKFVPDKDADLESCNVERDRHAVTVQFLLGVAR